MFHKLILKREEQKNLIEEDHQKLQLNYRSSVLLTLTENVPFPLMVNSPVSAMGPGQAL